MSDAEDLSDDEVRCPFCHRNVWWGGEGGPCEHLLADWALDPADNGGGVLGEMLNPHEGIAGAEELAKVSRKLCAWVWRPGGETLEVVQTRLRLAANAVAGKNPPWWAALQDAILNYFKPEVFLFPDDPDDKLADDPMMLADFGNPMAEAITRNLPGITVTYEILGGMASGTSIFVWSDDPVAGRATIDAAVASVIMTVEMVVVAMLDASDS